MNIYYLFVKDNIILIKIYKNIINKIQIIIIIIIKNILYKC